MTAPGVLTQTQNGLGYGDVEHADGSLVTPKNPAQIGETVSVYLTGLGAVNPAISDGSAGLATAPFNTTTNTITAYINSVSSATSVAGDGDVCGPGAEPGGVVPVEPDDSDRGSGRGQLPGDRGTGCGRVAIADCDCGGFDDVGRAGRGQRLRYGRGSDRARSKKSSIIWFICRAAAPVTPWVFCG